LGTVLMEGVRDLARRAGCAYIVLLGGVFTINERAIRFYEKVGLRKMGTYGGREGPQSWDMMMEV
jgi:GNAT superfamily N-acetyltransferase